MLARTSMIGKVHLHSLESLEIGLKMIKNASNLATSDQ